MFTGKRHGDLAQRIAEDIKARRRLEAGLDPPPFNPLNLPTLSVEEHRRRELEGGVVIVGRPTFKEFMTGLKRGWTESLEKIDKEEMLAVELQSDGRFDEPPEPDAPLNIGDVDDEPIPTASKLPSSKGLSPFTPPHLRGSQQSPSSSSSSTPKKADPASTIPPPAIIPPHPPLLLVGFLNRIGIMQIPLMIWDFFNERHRVRSGAEAAYKLVMNETRPFLAPPPSLSNFLDDPTTSPAQPFQTEVPASPIPTDLDFGVETEVAYKSSIKAFASNIEKAREGYYKDLPGKLETARAIARGTREPTKDEQNYPPPTEVQLRAERLKKEMRWRNDLAGWEIIKPESEVAWDERFRGVLKVFVEPAAYSLPDEDQKTKTP